MAILSIGELLGMGPSELSGLIPYSGLEYSGTAITGISGSAIGGVGGLPESSVSAIASSYAESAASSKVDQSAFDDCCSAVNDALSGISGAVSGVTGQTGNYIDWSSSGAFQPSGNYQTAGDYAFNSALTAYQPIGDYAFNSSLSGKLDNSASSTWYPMTGNPSGFLTEHQSLSGYATEAYVDSSVSGKQDASGMSAYATTGDLSAKLDTSAVNFDGDSSHVTGISGVPLSAQGGGGGISFPMDIYIEDSASAILDTGTYRLSEYDWMNGALVISAFDDYSCHAAFIATRGSAEYSTAASAFYTEEGIRLYTGNSVEGTRIDADGVMADSIYADNGYFKSLGTNGSTASAFSLDSAGVSGRSGAQSSWKLTPSGTEGYGWKLNKTGVSGSGWKFGSSEYNKLTSVYDTVSANSANWATGGGIDSTTCSAIASSYAESAASSKLDVSAVNFDGDSSHVTGISGIPIFVSSIPLTSTDGSVIITNQGTYADVLVTGTTGDLMVSGISILGLFRWATSQGYQP